MKKLILIILCLLTISPSFAESIPIVRIENVEDNGVKAEEIQPMRGFRLLEFDPKTKNIKKLPDIEADKTRQTEIKVDNIKKDDDKKIKIERIKFNEFEN